MDYFKFDLQMFAASITVDCISFADAMTTTTQYLVEGEWKTADNLALNDVIQAELTGGVLTVSATEADANIAVINATAAQLAGVTLKVVESMKCTKAKEGDIPPEISKTDPEGAAVTGTFTLGTIDEDMTAAVKSVGTEPATAAQTVAIQADSKLAISEGVVVTANEIAYTAAEAGATLKINASGEANLVTGAVSVPKDKGVKTELGTIANSNSSDGAITVAADSTVTAATANKATYTVTLGASTAYSINDRIYTNDAGAVVTVSKDAEKTAWTEKLTAGSVSVAAKDGETVASVVTTIGTFKNLGGAAIVVDADGAVTSVPANTESYEFELGKNQAVTINEKAYTDAGEGTAVIGVTKAASAAPAATLTGGSVKVVKNAVITANGNQITNSATAEDSNLITVDAKGNVTALEANGKATVQIPEDGATTIGNVTYTNAGDAAVTIQGLGLTAASLTSDAGVVTLQGNGAPALFTAGDYTYTHTTNEKKTVTVSKTGVVSAMDKDATVVVAVSAAGKTVTFGEATYTSKGDAATFRATALDKVTLDSGTVDRAIGTSIIANNTTITNNAAAVITVTNEGVVSGLAGGVKFTAQGTAENAKASTYEVKADADESKIDILVTGATVGYFNDAVKASATVTLDAGAATVAGKTAENVSFAYDGEHNSYALKVKENGTLEAVGVADAAAAKVGSIGYFQFAGSDKDGKGTQTVTFHGTDDAAATALGTITIDATNLTEGETAPLDTIIATGVGTAAANVKFTNLAYTVNTVTDGTAESYAPSYALTDNAEHPEYYTITPAAKNAENDVVKYFKLAADGDPTDKGVQKLKAEAWTPEGTEEEIAGALENNSYFIATTKKDGSVNITYHEGKGATKFVLHPDNSKLIVATTNAEANTVVSADGTVLYAVDAGSKTGVTVAEDSENTSIIYSTTFAWAAGTYYVDKQADPEATTTLVAGATGTTNDPTKEYNKVVVTGADGSFKAVISAVTGDKMTEKGTSDIATITLANTVTTFDATELGVSGATIAAAVTDTTVKLAAGDVATKVVGLGVVSIQTGTADAITYTASDAEAGSITVKGGKAVSGVFSVEAAASTTATLTGAAETFTASQASSVKVEGGDAASAATVTVSDGVITSVTGLGEAKEKFTVTMGDPAATTPVTYTYTYNSTDKVITRVGASGNMYAAADDGTVNILDSTQGGTLTYTAPTMIDAAFSWATADPDKTYFFTSGASTSEEKHGVRVIDSGAGEEAVKDAIYIGATVTENSSGRTLTLEAYKGTALHGVEVDDGKGSTYTFTVDADGAGAIIYEKEVGLFAGTLAMTGVAKNSQISGLGASDTVATASLKANDYVTIGTYHYQTAVDGAMEFKGNALNAGKVVVTSSDIAIADGSSVEMGESGQTAVLTVEAGAVKTITGLDKGETLTVTKSPVTTTYEAHSDTIIWKTVSGDPTPANNGTFVTKLAKAGDDVVAGATGEYKYVKATSYSETFDWSNKTWNFIVSSEGILSGVDTANLEDDVVTSIDHEDEGKTFVQLVVADDKLTLKQGTVNWNGSLGEVADISGADYDIAITLPDGGKKIKLSRPDTTGVVTVENALAESEIDLSGAKDTVSTVALADNATIKIGEKTFKSAKAANALSFTANKLTGGTVHLTETVILSGGETVEISKDGAAVLAATAGKVTSITGVGAEGETVTVTSADGKTVTTYAAIKDDTTHVMKTVTINGTEVSKNKVKLAEAGGDVIGAKAVAEETYPQQFTWPAAGASVTFYAAVSAGAITIKQNGDKPAIEAQEGVVFYEATATAEAGKPITLTLTPKMYNGKSLVDADDATVASQVTTINITGEAAGTAISYDHKGTQQVVVTNAAAGSVFTGLGALNTVTSIAALAKDATISVNGVEFKAAGTTQISVIGSDVDEVKAAIIDGNIVVKGEVTSAVGTVVSTNDAGDGVEVTFADGAVDAIKDLESGETVTVTLANGDITEYSYDGTTYTRKTTTVADGTRMTATFTLANPGDDIVAAAESTKEDKKLEVYSGLVCELGKLATAYAVMGDTATEFNTTGVWKEVKTGDTLNTFVKASVDIVGNLTIAKVTATDEKTLGTPGALPDTQTVTIDVNGAGHFNFTNKNGAKGVVLKNIGGGSSVLAASGETSEVWSANDSVTTAGLAVDTDEYGLVTYRASVTVGGKTFTAGADGTKLVIEGYDSTETVPIVKSGAVLLDETNMATLVSTGKEGDKDVRTVVTYSATSGDASVTVDGGDVTAITGLGDDYFNEESVTVTRKVGEADPVTVTYTGANGTVTRSQQVATGYNNTETFSYNPYTEPNKNILDSSTVWTVTNKVTKQDFGWSEDGSVGYFALGDVVTAQGGTTYIDGSHNSGQPFVKVTASAKDGLATITGVSYVKMLDNGTFEETAAPSSDVIEISGATLTKGITLPDHTAKIAIVNAQPDAVYTGLNDADTVSATTFTAGKTVTLTRTVGKKQETSEFTIAAADQAFQVTGAGTVVKGTFTVGDKETLTGSAVVEAEGNTTAAKTITMSGGTANVIFANGEIDGVKKLANGATATIAHVQYDAKKGEKQYETTVIANDGTNVTMTKANSAFPADIAMTRLASGVTDSTNVFGMVGYKMASGFDYGVAVDTKTKKPTGAIGLFELTEPTLEQPKRTTTIEKQGSTSTVVTEGKHYIMVGATTAKGTTTIGYLQTLAAGAKDMDPSSSNDIKNVSLTLPDTVGNLTLAATAFQPASSSETRKYAINVTGAQAGKSYIGFNALDTIDAGTLDAKATITVGETAKTATKFTVAAEGATKFRGDGKAINGTFTVGTGFGTAKENGDFTTKISGTAKAAVAVVADGEVTSVKGLAAKQAFTVTKTLANGTVETTTYTAAAIKGDKDNLEITKTVTTDGVATAYTKNIAVGGEIINGVDYGTADGAAVNSNFDWTPANGSGYFALGKLTGTDLGTVEVKPTTTKITGEQKDDYYLKVAFGEADGTTTVTGVTLEKVNENGTLTADPTKLSTIIAGTLNITAPASTKLNINRTALTGFPTGVHLAVSDAAAGSTFTNLENGDSVASSKLKEDSTIAVNGTTYTSANADYFKATIAGGEVKLSDGAVKVGAGTYKTTAGQFATSDSVYVKVVNGEVADIFFKTESTVTVTDGAGNVAAYYDGGVNFTTLVATKTIQTAALAQGADIAINGTGKNIEAGGGALKFYAPDTSSIQLEEGTLLLDNSNDDFTLKGGTAVNFTVAGAAHNVLVTAKGGKVVSITGMKAGDSIQIGGVGGTTYTAVSDTVVRKTTAAGTVTAFLTEANGDVVNAAYLEKDADISPDENPLEGQFSWADVHGRSTGYFNVTVKSTKTGTTKTAKPIAEQSAKTVVTAPKKGTSIYVVANTIENNAGLQELSIGAIETTLKTVEGKTMTVINSADKATLLDSTASLTVTAPKTKMYYSKEAADKFHITLNGVAANSEIVGLDAGDTVKTAVLAIGEEVTMQNGAYTYMAGAKGALEFQGEGTDRTTLLNGTIKLAGGESALLSGSKGSADDDITLTATSGAGNAFTVVVKNGDVTSITGLTSYNGGVNSDAVTWTKGAKTVTYTVLNTEASAWDKAGNETAWTTMVERKEVEGTTTTTTYATFTNTKNVYATVNTKTGAVSNGYKPAGTTPTPVNTDKLYVASELVKNKPQSRTVYVAIADQDNDVHQKDKYVANATLGETTKATAELNKIDPTDTANRGDYYLAATVTTSNGVTTISKIEVAQVNAQGEPKVVKGWTVKNVAINGAKVIDDGYAKLNYTIQKGTYVTITNAAVGSVFNGTLKPVDTATGYVDTIDSAAADGYELSKGTVTVYNVNAGEQETRKVTYTPGTKDNTMVKISTSDTGVTDGQITSLTGLDTANESVTIVEQTVDGEITTVYAVSKDGTTLTKTITAEDGQKTVATASLGDVTAATYDWIADTYKALKDDATANAVVSEFNWTMDKKDTGYFEVVVPKKGDPSAAVKTQTKAVTISPYANATKKTGENDKNYLAVNINADGVLADIKQVHFDHDSTSATFNTLVDTTTKFTGTINVTAPTGVALIFDRSLVDAATIADTATVAITGAAAASNISNLKVGDKVTTAKLKANNFVRVNGSGFDTAAAGALSILVQEVNDTTAATVTAGTVWAWAGNPLYVGKKAMIEGGNGTVTVAVSKSGAAYTVGDIGEGESFTVKDFALGTTKTYTKSANALFCEAADGSKSVYSIGAKTAIASTALDGTAGWTACNADTLTFKADNTLVSGKAVTVDLAAADKRITTDEAAAVKAGLGTGTLATNAYDFVIDKYMASPAKFAGAASVISAGSLINLQELEEALGIVTVGGYNATTKKYENSVYDASAVNAAQTIKAANTWRVIGSGLDDTITGAAKGEDTLRGGAGNDTLTGGGASDTFRFAAGDTGHDVVKSYVTGKDRIVFAGGGQYAGFDIDAVELVETQVGKSKSADVRLNDDNDLTDTNSVLLSGMGNGKAVTINVGGENKTYYFGSQVATKGMNFTFVEGAYYVGKAGTTTANTLTVTTDKNKAAAKALGDAVEVNLSDEEHYKNIQAVDASKSGNAVILTAAESGSTLKGGTYQTTLKGGAGQDSLVGGKGEDVFWFDNVEKADTVSGYTSGKDSVYLGNAAGSTAEEVNGMTIKAVGNDVVITNSDAGSVTLQKAVNAAKAVTILADETGTEKLSYYVGKTGTTNAKTGVVKNAVNTFTATLGKDTEASVAGGTAGNFTSYYVGNDTATDTLKLVGADKKTAVGSQDAAATFDMTSNHLSSIDTIDASGLAAGSYVKLVGKAEGTYKLIGSAKAAKETFDLKAVNTTASTDVTVTGLDLADVIEIAAGVTATKDVTKSTAKNTYFTLTSTADPTQTYGTVMVSGVGSDKFSASYSAGEIKRTK